jgi:hypothetical protein
MNTSTRACLRLHFHSDPIVAFFPLLQMGFHIEVTTGNLLELLGRICDMDCEKMRHRIQTVFLNGKPVDDLAGVVVADNDCVALSAAMPGLVGATMRSGGVLAGLRQSISHRSRQAPSCPRQGMVIIKLFNLLIKELGPRFLQKGILLKADGIVNLLESIFAADPENCHLAELDSRRIDTQDLARVHWPAGPGFIHLKVTFGPASAMTSPPLNTA